MRGFVERHDLLFVFLYLLLAEAVAFGPIVRHIGFYLDDWTALNQLHFLPQALPQMILQYLQSDVRVLPRPLEAVHFPLMFACFGLKPLGYHLFNGVMEVLAGWLLYLNIRTVTVNKLLAFLAASLFLIYPNHDASHYWMMSGSIALSLAFYLASLHFSLSAVLKGGSARAFSLFASLAFFSLSIFNYETFLPLAVLNFICPLMIMPAAKRWQSKLVTALACVSPAVVATGLLLAYQRLYVAKLSKVWMHAVNIQPDQIMQTVSRGVDVSLPWGCFPFFVHEACAEFDGKLFLRLLPAILLLAAFSILMVASLIRSELESKSGPPIAENLQTQAALAKGLAIGLATLIFGYSIFGLNREYMPVLETIVNRVNVSGAIGACLLYACILVWLGAAFQKAFGGRLGNKQVAVVAVESTGLIALLLFFSLTNWSLSKPWVASWLTQKRLAQVVKECGPQLHSGDSLLLTNCPHYVRWSPVFDGVWDFQAMTQLQLDNKSIHAGVVSPRLVVTRNSLTDVSSGFKCAEYSYDGLYLLFPSAPNLVKVANADQFVNAVAQRGLGFDLSPAVPSKWQHDLSVAASSDAIPR